MIPKRNGFTTINGWLGNGREILSVEIWLKGWEQLRSITHKDKNGKPISDLTKVKVPEDLQRSIFKILNPSMEIDRKVVKVS